MGKKQKSYNADIKVRVALDAMRSQKTVAQIDREYQTHPTQVNWLAHLNLYYHRQACLMIGRRSWGVYSSWIAYKKQRISLQLKISFIRKSQDFMKYKTIAVQTKLTLWRDSVTEVSSQIQSYTPTVPVEGGIFEMDNECSKQKLLCQHMPGMIHNPDMFKDLAWLSFRTLLQKNIYKYLQSCDTAPPLDYDALQLDKAAAWASEQKPFVEFCIARWYQKISALKDLPPVQAPI